MHPQGSLSSGKGHRPPRDIICFINDYEIKEAVLKKAWEKERLDYDGRPIQIYQDLLAITLKNHRDLRPLLEALRNKGICYRWKFPFGLSATHQGRSALLTLLRVPEELEAFCKHLDLPYIHLPDWYAEFQVPKLSRRNMEEEPMDAQDTRYRWRRSPSPSALIPPHKATRLHPVHLQLHCHVEPAMINHS